MPSSCATPQVSARRFWYADDEVVVVASERPAIQTAFALQTEEVQELTPGHALIIRKDGTFSEEKVREPLEKRACSFERIYFSRGSDRDVYRERIALGRSVCPAILEAVDHDLENTVFCFIPNTAEVAFYGMLKEMDDELDRVKERRILALGSNPIPEQLRAILGHCVRAWRRSRSRMPSCAPSSPRTMRAMTWWRTCTTSPTVRYVRGVDNLVVIDDSIVRGTTLKQSILKMLGSFGTETDRGGEQCTADPLSGLLRYRHGEDGRPRSVPRSDRLVERDQAREHHRRCVRPCMWRW